MHASSTLYVVEGGDHSLMVAKADLKALESSQEQVDDGVQTTVARFLRGVLNPSSPTTSVRT
jgi:hypothetical protein